MSAQATIATASPTHGGVSSAARRGRHPARRSRKVVAVAIGRIIGPIRSAGTAPRDDDPTGDGQAAARLSERELDVVRLVVDGRSNDEIAARLGIGAKTVESHLRRLFERLDVASRTELATRALREGWLDVPPAG
jgi:DNA-binding NarL/FixJ family response regulator